MIIIENIVPILKKLIKSQKKYTTEESIEYIFSGSFYDQNVEEKYIKNLLNKISYAFSKLNNIKNEDGLISNQIPYFLLLFVLIFRNLKDFIKKNKIILEKILNINSNRESDFFEAMNNRNLSIEESFSNKFIDFFIKLFYEIFNKIRCDNIFGIHLRLKEDLESNFFEFFSKKEIENISDYLIPELFENIKLNYLNIDDSNNYIKENIDQLDKDIELLNIKISFKTVDKNDYNIFSKLSKSIFSTNYENKYDSSYENQVIFFRGYILYTTISSDEILLNKNLENKDFKFKTGKLSSHKSDFKKICVIKNDENILFCSLISNDFFDFTNIKIDEDRESIYYNNSDTQKNIREKLNLLIILRKGFLINTFISKVKVSLFIKNYLREHDIFIIDRIPNSIFNELSSIFEIEILGIENILSLEKLYLYFCENIRSYSNRAELKYQTCFVYEDEFKKINIFNYLMIINNLKDIFGDDIKSCLMLNKENYNFIIIGNICKNKNSNLIEKIKKISNKLSIEIKNENDIQNIIILSEIIKNKFIGDILENEYCIERVRFLRIIPKTIIIKKTFEKLNEIRKKSFNFILKKYSNLILSKLEKSEVSASDKIRFFNFRKFFTNKFNLVEKEISLLDENLFILNKQNKFSCECLNNINQNLFKIIMVEYENFLKDIVSTNSIAKYNIEYFDILLINQQDIILMCDLIKFMIGN